MLLAFAPIPQANDSDRCSHIARGTTVPNTSGTPLVINRETGTVISANFFDSGAIVDTRDGNEFVEVCILPADSAGRITAEITTDVGQDDNTRIKAYPEIIVGTKFGNQYETSHRYYANTGLQPDQQWPVLSDSIAPDGQPYQFANLTYVSEGKGVGLPAFTNNLPQIDISFTGTELNVEGAERDVMLESWFHDTSANAGIIGNNIVTGQPIANSLDNIVGAGHAYADTLNNLLLEMMVHIAPLSKNDVSGATRNPGKYQLTEIYSGLDTDGDGIDDYFDVDSHVNRNNSQHPQPGKYSTGIDNNGDGIDDGDILPVKIGKYEYSIWYGETYLSPVVIYSRETNVNPSNDFDPTIPDINLTTEGPIELNWNLFLDYTLNSLELQLAAADVEWASGTNNPFPRMRAAGGAISGVEIGVEPQTNGNTDEPYTLTLENLDIRVDGIQFGLIDTNDPKTAFSTALEGTYQAGQSIDISGATTDECPYGRLA